MITIRLDGPPQGKGRPRSAKGIMYAPKETRAYETRLKWAAKEVMKGRAPLDGPVSVTLFACYPIPGSWAKKRRDGATNGTVLPTVKPDLDNVIKMLDALNEIVFHDDAQIVSIGASKAYGLHPGLRIFVEPTGARREEPASKPGPFDGTVRAI